MKHIITDTGFEVDLDIELLDDMELFDTIIEIDEGKYENIPKFLRKILSEKDIKRLYDHVRLESGRVPASKVALEIGNIFATLNEVEGKKIIGLALATSRHRDSLICDFAEYYHIYDIDELPLDLRATLFSGLPHESRTILKLAGQPVKTELLFLASIIDKLNALLGVKDQESLVAILLGKTAKENQYQIFSSGAEFERRLNQLRKG